MISESSRQLSWLCLAWVLFPTLHSCVHGFGQVLAVSQQFSSPKSALILITFCFLNKDACWLAGPCARQVGCSCRLRADWEPCHLGRLDLAGDMKASSSRTQGASLPGATLPVLEADELRQRAAKAAWVSGREEKTDRGPQCPLLSTTPCHPLPLARSAVLLLQLYYSVSHTSLEQPSLTIPPWQPPLCWFSLWDRCIFHNVHCGGAGGLGQTGSGHTLIQLGPQDQPSHDVQCSDWAVRPAPASCDCRLHNHSHG